MGDATQGAADAAAAANGNGEAADQPWYSSIEDTDLRGWTELKGWKSPGEAAKSARELESKLGAPAEQLLKLPKADAKPEEWAPIYDRLGRPKTPEDYKLQVPEGDSGDFAKAIAPVLHKHGITAAQAKGLNEDWNALIGGMAKDAQDKRAAAQGAELADLKKEWSGNVFEQRAELGRRAMREYGGALGATIEDQKATLSAIEDAIGTAKLMKLFASIGEKQGEHGFVDGENGNKTFGMTPEAAQVKKDQLMSDPAFQTNYLKGNKTAEWAQIQELNKIILSRES